MATNGLAINLCSCSIKQNLDIEMHIRDLPPLAIHYLETLNPRILSLPCASSNMATAIELLVEHRTLMPRIEDELSSLRQQIESLQTPLDKQTSESTFSSNVISNVAQDSPDLNVTVSPQKRGFGPGDVTPPPEN